jgi:hypothetical protein
LAVGQFTVGKPELRCLQITNCLTAFWFGQGQSAKLKENFSVGEMKCWGWCYFLKDGFWSGKVFFNKLKYQMIKRLVVEVLPFKIVLG